RAAARLSDITRASSRRRCRASNRRSPNERLRHRAVRRHNQTGSNMHSIRYSVAACQTDMPNPTERREMRRNTERMLAMIDAAVAGAAPFLPVRLVVFPEFAHAAPVFPTVAELRQ